jgi:hypothetical protein
MVVKLVQCALDFACFLLTVRMIVLDDGMSPLVPQILPAISSLFRLFTDQRTFWEMREDPYFYFSLWKFWSFLYLVSIPLATGMELYSAKDLGDDFTPILHLGFQTLHCLDLIFVGLAFYSTCYWRILEPQKFYGPRRLHLQKPADSQAEWVNHSDGSLETLYQQQTNRDVSNNGGSSSTSSKLKPKESESSIVLKNSNATTVPTIDNPSEKQGDIVKSSQMQNTTPLAQLHPLMSSVGAPNAIIYWSILNVATSMVMLSLALLAISETTAYDRDYSW